MAPENASRIRGLEDLRWQSLTRPERLLVAGLLEAALDAPAFAHLDNVAYELREAAAPGAGVPLVLTSLQNRAIAQVLERQAESLETASERHAEAAVARSAHYVASYLYSLVDRLVRGGSAAPEAAQERIVQLLLLDAKRPSSKETDVARTLLHASEARLQALGLGTTFEPVLKAYVGDAVALMDTRPTRAVPLDDPAFEFEIVDSTEERLRVAEATFDASIDVLAKGTPVWSSFLSDLEAGKVKGCEGAREWTDAAESAARTAFEIVSAVRKHLQDLAGSPWEAVSPGLKSIVDSYPALKRHKGLQEFIRAEVAKSFQVKPTAWRP